MKTYVVPMRFVYWEFVEVKAKDKQSAFNKVVEKEKIKQVVERIDIPRAELEWDYNWLDTIDDCYIDEIVEEVE